ncbi:hypothetical protein CP8484711_1308A, partial [Chlamydia psittaci 84-8471/1]
MLERILYYPGNQKVEIQQNGYWDYRKHSQKTSSIWIIYF